jgi:hypothetical protein
VHRIVDPGSVAWEGLIPNLRNSAEIDMPAPGGTRLAAEVTRQRRM